MAKKTEQLNKLLKRLTDLEDSLPLSETRGYLDTLLAKETKKFQTQFKENDTVKYLDEFNTKLEQFKRDFRLGPIIDEIEKIQTDIENTKTLVGQEFSNRATEAENKYKELKDLITSTKKDLQKLTGGEVGKLLTKIDDLRSELVYQDKNSQQRGQSIQTVISGLEQKLEQIKESVKTESANRGTLTEDLNKRFQDGKKNSDLITNEIKDLRALIGKIGRGGSANRQIFIGGNDALTKYTDINLKAGSNVTLTYADNNTTKKVDVTIAASGSGGGIARSVSTISVDTNAGSTADTDYVYICDTALTLTMPTAANNDNLYTIKNTSAGTITIARSGTDTIDGDTSLQLVTQYTSVDLISDGVSAWQIT